MCVCEREIITTRTLKFWIRVVFWLHFYVEVVFWLHFYVEMLRAMARLTMVEEGDNGGRWWLELGGVRG